MKRYHLFAVAAVLQFLFCIFAGNVNLNAQENIQFPAFRSNTRDSLVRIYNDNLPYKQKINILLNILDLSDSNEERRNTSLKMLITSILPWQILQTNLKKRCQDF